MSQTLRTSRYVTVARLAYGLAKANFALYRRRIIARRFDSAPTFRLPRAKIYLAPNVGITRWRELR